MTRRVVGAAAGAAVVVMAAFAIVQRPGSQEVTDILVRLNGPLRLAADDTASTVVVVGHDAHVEGTVREQLVVIGGTARVDGSVLGNLVVVGGRAKLGPRASVAGNVVLHESELERDPQARVGGIVRREAEFDWSPIVGWIFWLSLTLVLLVVGLAFAAVAGLQLADAASRIARQTGPVILTALLLVVGLPALALLAFLSLIGIPFALLLVLFVFPILAGLGYVVTGCWIGLAALRRWAGEERRERERRHPYLAVVIGIAVLQVVGLIPVLGGLVALLASPLGAGALVYRTWQALRGEPAEP